LVVLQDLKATNCYHYSVTTVCILNIENISWVTKQSSNSWMSLRVWVNYQHCLVQSDLFLIFLIFRIQESLLHRFYTSFALIRHFKRNVSFIAQRSMTFSNMTTLVLSSFFEINVLNEITIFLSVFHGHLCSNRIYQRS
jgi:hypothetical protein